MLYSREEAAGILGISLVTLDKYRSERKLGYYQRFSGCKVLISQEHIEQFLQRYEVTPKRAPDNTRRKQIV